MRLAPRIRAESSLNPLSDFLGPLLFVTGPSYDDVLAQYFADIEFKALDLPARQFAMLVHPDLPEHSYRLYHPNYLNRDRKGRWDKALGILGEQLSWPKSL
jgi:hypothetical protein